MFTKKFHYYLLPMVFFFAPLLAFAVDAPTDFLGIVLAIWNAIKNHAATAVILVPVIQLLKSHEVLGVLRKIGLQGRAMQVTVAILTVLGFVVDAVVQGQSWPAAAIAGLFTSGGAMLVYNAFKSVSAQS